MKILAIENKKALYSIGEKVNKPIKDIDSNDVLDIVEYILKENSVELDPIPDKEDCPNEADKVLYDELHRQFSDLLSNRDSIIDEIDQQFKEAEEYYSESIEQ